MSDISKLLSHTLLIQILELAEKQKRRAAGNFPEQTPPYTHLMNEARLIANAIAELKALPATPLETAIEKTRR